MPEDGVHAHEDLIAAGWSMNALRHAVSAGDLERLQQGVYSNVQLAGERWDQDAARLLRAADGAAIACSRATIGHHAAALSYQLPTLWLPDRPCRPVQRSGRWRMHIYTGPLWLTVTCANLKSGE
jgi:hypothetical protein